MTGAQGLGGLHHVTGIAGDAQRNVDFYTGVLGLRLVKVTVNHDDPGTYHLYYGDDAGRPGTLLTFFVWPGARHGTRGAGQAVVVGLSIPSSALGWWAERLGSAGVTTRRPAGGALVFGDPDGLALAMVGSDADTRPGVRAGGGGVPADRSIRGISAVTLSVEEPDRTSAMLSGLLGFRRVEAADGPGLRRLETGRGGPGGVVEVAAADEHARPGRVSVGCIHHVAWRTPDATTQQDWRSRLLAAAIDVTPVIDRLYFRSIYFREPGGVLFEIATDPPGMTADEPPDRLGTSLRLPPWLETDRERLEGILPQIKLPLVA